MQIEQMPVADLRPYERNSRTHSEAQVEQIIASIRAFGFTSPVLIDADNRIIAGHGRVLAATKMGMATVPCLRLEGLTEEQIRAYVIADNKLAENAGWDMDLLRLEIGDLKKLGFDLELMGFDTLELGELLSYIAPTDGQTDPDAVPDVPAEPITKPGDLWLLGHHRLLCGDSTMSADVGRLMRGGTADMVFTDPPYNVDYQGSTKEKLTIKNDKMSSEAFYCFLRDAFRAAAAVVTPGSPIYVCHSDSEGLNFRKAILDTGWLVKSLLIWVKNHFMLGRRDYHIRHESILYGWREGATHRWYGGRKQSSVVEEMPGLVFQQESDGVEISFSDGVRSVAVKVPSYEVVGASDGTDTTIWKVDKPWRNSEHQTMKPVEIPRRAIENSSKNGGVVYEPFMGSGSTLIACEMIGRLCYGLECDPKYCDVIVTRWEQFTGRKAELAT